QRRIDLAIEVPKWPLKPVISGEVWKEIYERLIELIESHRTTLVMVNTRRLAERTAHRLSEQLGAAQVAAHHGSLAKEARLDAEMRLREGQLKVLVATASLELGIDIGHVDLVCQISSPHRIATLLQRVGRSGHTVRGVPKGSRMSAILNGGAIPEVFDYRVLLEPEGHFLGTLNEDFAIESLPGDVFQLGNTSWRILRIGNGVVRVADAEGQPPSMPFWLGEAPARSDEMTAAVSRLRAGADALLPGPDVPRREGELGSAIDFLVGHYFLPASAAEQIAAYLGEGKRALGAVPTTQTLVLERFFDESG